MDGARPLRKVEQHVLGRLEQDARTPYSVIGKGLRKSQQQVSYTVNALQERGVIRGFYAIIDYAKLDLLHFRVHFHVTYLDEERFERLIGHLIAHPNTCWIAMCGGSHDLICTFLAANPSRFNKVLRAVMEAFPDQLGNYTVVTTVVNRHGGRKYLFRDPAASGAMIFGGDREPCPLDGQDRAILDALSADARRSALSLAAELGVAPKTVIQRIRRLREREVIKAFRPLLDHEAFGHFSSLLLIRYHNISAETEKRLIAYLDAHPHVVSAIKTLGNWDLEIEIEVGEQRQLRRIEMAIRKEFAPLIQGIENVPLYTTFKLRYFPPFLLEA